MVIGSLRRVPGASLVAGGAWKRILDDRDLATARQIEGAVAAEVLRLDPSRSTSPPASLLRWGARRGRADS